MTTKTATPAPAKTATPAAAPAKKAAAKAQASPATSTVPIPATVTDTINMPSTPAPVASKKASPKAPSKTPSPATSPEADASTLDATKAKVKPLKLAEAKVNKWIDLLKKAQEASPNKNVAVVLSGLETILANKNGSANKNAVRNLSEYNLFVQQHIKEVAAQNPTLSNKEVMVKIAERWQNHKAAAAPAAPAATAQ